MKILRSNGLNPSRFVKIVKKDPIYYALGSADDIFESQKTTKNVHAGDGGHLSDTVIIRMSRL